MFAQTVALWRLLLRRGSPACEQNGVAVDDRRVWVRFPADLETRLVAPNRPEASGCAARIRDISRGGIKLLVNRSFEPGSLLTVVLPGASGETSLAVLACVVHCQRTPEGEWHIGCSFSAELDDDDLRAFGALKTRPEAPDGRNWTRFPCDVTATYQLLSDGDATHRPARVQNISASGVALLVEDEIPAGTGLSAELHGAHGQTFTILACVVHLTPAPEGGYVLGCNFIRELKEADLRQLL